MNSSFLIMILISYSPINIFVTIILPKYIIKKRYIETRLPGWSKLFNYLNVNCLWTFSAISDIELY